MMANASDLTGSADDVMSRVMAATKFAALHAYRVRCLEFPFIGDVFSLTLEIEWFVLIVLCRQSTVIGILV
jgi:hypothetical protein